MLLVIVAFGIGAGAGAVGYKNIAHWMKKSSSETPLPAYDRQQELLRDAFTDELISGEKLVNAPCKTAQDVHAILAGQFTATVPSSANLYDDLVVGAPAGKGTGRLNVYYQYHFEPKTRIQLQQSGWAYSSATSSARNKAVLIIPGSGMNESSKIFRNDPRDYHGDIAQLAAGSGADVYVLVKPNEDFLAIHDGKKKLSYNFITNHLINSGRSYSGQYLCDALAIVKYLQKQYNAVYVVGLSQGGAAALYVALQSQPTGAVVASGYSVTQEIIESSGPNQIILPGIESKYTPAAIRGLIEKSPTRFLFTYGRKELGGYRVEAEEGLTAKAFASLGNVKFVVHDGGHVFAREAVKEFLSVPADVKK